MIILFPLNKILKSKKAKPKKLFGVIIGIVIGGIVLSIILATFVDVLAIAGIWGSIIVIGAISLGAYYWMKAVGDLPEAFIRE